MRLAMAISSPLARPSIKPGAVQCSQPETITELLEGNGFSATSRLLIRRVDDPTDLEGFLERRTQLGMSRTRFESIAPDVRARCVALAQERLGALTPDDFIAREVSLYAWARRAS